MTSEPERNEAADPAYGGPADLPVVIPVLAEDLSIEKVVEKTGRALRVRVAVEDETRRVALSDQVEDVSVERVPVNRFVEARTPPREEGDVLVVPVYETVEVVEQRLLLREEVRITRRRRTVTREEEVVVRREVPVVERRDAADGAWQPDKPEA